MHIAMNERFLQEREQYDLRACCEHCAHFAKGPDRCAMLYPVKLYQRETLDKAQMGERIHFCKMFEVDDA